MDIIDIALGKKGGSAGDSSAAELYTKRLSLTDSEKELAKENIGVPKNVIDGPSTGSLIENAVSENRANGEYAHAEGRTTAASGTNSHAEGSNTVASGEDAHSEGYATVAKGIYSHAEGRGTAANKLGQHVFGEYNTPETYSGEGETKVRGTYVEIVGNGTGPSAKSNARTLDWNGNEVLSGKLTIGADPTGDMDVATKKYVDNNAGGLKNIIDVDEYTDPDTGETKTNLHSISEGDVKNNIVSGAYSHAEGSGTKVSGSYSHAEGYNTTIPDSGYCAHAEGGSTKATAQCAHAEGYMAAASGGYSHAEGYDTKATGTANHAEGWQTEANSFYTHAEGGYSKANGSFSHAEGNYTTASGGNSHAEGYNTAAAGSSSHAEGNNCKTGANSGSAHAEGYYTEANGEDSHSEGFYAKTGQNARYSHAEGNYTQANGAGSHSEGMYSIATGNYSHAEGCETKALGYAAHSEGFYAEANGDHSHADGSFTIASREAQHVFGAYNEEDIVGESTSARGKYIEIVGNGDSVYDSATHTRTTTRSNARTLDWNGNEWIAGKLTVGADPTSDMDVTTKQYVDSNRGNVFSGDVKIASAVRDGVLLSGTADGMRETARGKNLVITYPILISTESAGAGTTRHDFLHSGVINLSKTNGVVCTFTPYRVVYLKGKVNGVTFTVDATDMFAQTFDDGYSYMLLGYAISAEAIYLYPHNPVYQMIGNALVPYAPSYTFSLTYDQTTGRLSLLKDGTEISFVTISKLPVTITRDGDTLRVNNVPAVTSITQTDSTLALT